MAEEEKMEGAGEPKKSSKIKKIALLSILAILLIGASVAVTLYMTGFFDLEKKERSTEILQDLESTVLDENGVPITERDKKLTKQVPDPRRFEQSYLDFKSKFIVNIPNSKKYVQFSMSVMTHYDKRVLENVEKHETALRSAVIQLISLEPHETYQTNEGIESLRLRLKDEINRVLMRHEDFGGVEEVYFTEFVIQ
jgi:flagellar FliL protein